MDILILCGGFATRLEPITLFVPKPLLPIGGKPILDYIVDDLEKTDADRIIISANKKFEDQFMYWITNKRARGLTKKIELVIEPTLDNGSKFGAIKGIQYAIEKTGIKDDFMVIAGDNFYDGSVSAALGYFEKSGRKATVCVHEVGSLEEARKLGIVETDGNLIKGFEEKPAEPKSTIASTGIYVYPKEVLPKFNEYLLGKNNPDAPGYFLKWLIGNTEVHAVVQEGEWFDIGTLETYSRVYSLFMAGNK
jgi:glucose-1-phosphate thymidylyltransferase